MLFGLSYSSYHMILQVGLIFLLIYGNGFGDAQVVINEFHSSIDDNFLEVSFPTDHTVGTIDGTGILILNAKTANKKKTEYIMKAAIDLKGISVPNDQTLGVPLLLIL